MIKTGHLLSRDFIKICIILYGCIGIHAAEESFSLRHVEDRTVFLPGETVTVLWRLAIRGGNPLQDEVAFYEKQNDGSCKKHTSVLVCNCIPGQNVSVSNPPNNGNVTLKLPSDLLPGINYYLALGSDIGNPMSMCPQQTMKAQVTIQVAIERESAHIFNGLSNYMESRTVCPKQSYTVHALIRCLGDCSHTTVIDSTDCGLTMKIGETLTDIQFSKGYKADEDLLYQQTTYADAPGRRKFAEKVYYANRAVYTGRRQRGLVCVDSASGTSVEVDSPNIVADGEWHRISCVRKYSVTFSKSTGFCRGGYYYAQNRAMPHGKCLGPEFSRAQCEAECAQDPQCYAFDIPMTQRPEGKPGDGCCLHGAGNTGNKEYGRDCFVMSGLGTLSASVDGIAVVPVQVPGPKVVDANRSSAANEGRYVLGRSASAPDSYYSGLLTEVGVWMQDRQDFDHLTNRYTATEFETNQSSRPIALWPLTIVAGAADLSGNNVRLDNAGGAVAMPAAITPFASQRFSSFPANKQESAVEQGFRGDKNNRPHSQFHYDLPSTRGDFSSAGALVITCDTKGSDEAFRGARPPNGNYMAEQVSKFLVKCPRQTCPQTYATRSFSSTATSFGSDDDKKRWLEDDQSICATAQSLNVFTEANQLASSVVLQVEFEWFLDPCADRKDGYTEVDGDKFSCASMAPQCDALARVSWLCRDTCGLCTSVEPEWKQAMRLLIPIIVHDRPTLRITEGGPKYMMPEPLFMCNKREDCWPGGLCPGGICRSNRKELVKSHGLGNTEVWTKPWHTQFGVSVGTQSECKGIVKKDTGICYYFDRSLKNWYEMWDFCEDWGGTPAVIRSQSDHDWMVKQMSGKEWGVNTDVWLAGIQRDGMDIIPSREDGAKMKTNGIYTRDRQAMRREWEYCTGVGQRGVVTDCFHTFICESAEKYHVTFHIPMESNLVLDPQDLWISAFNWDKRHLVDVYINDDEMVEGPRAFRVLMQVNCTLCNPIHVARTSFSIYVDSDIDEPIITANTRKGKDDVCIEDGGTVPIDVSIHNLFKAPCPIGYFSRTTGSCYTIMRAPDVQSATSQCKKFGAGLSRSPGVLAQPDTSSNVLWFERDLLIIFAELYAEDDGQLSTWLRGYEQVAWNTPWDWDEYFSKYYITLPTVESSTTTGSTITYPTTTETTKTTALTTNDTMATSSTTTRAASTTTNTIFDLPFLCERWGLLDVDVYDSWTGPVYPQLVRLPPYTTFSTQTWQTKQVLRVQAFGDLIAEPFLQRVDYTAVVAERTLADQRWHGIQSVTTVRVLDNDIADFRIPSHMWPTESDGFQNYTIRLRTEPVYPVAIYHQLSTPQKYGRWDPAFPVLMYQDLPDNYHLLPTQQPLVGDMEDVVVGPGHFNYSSKIRVGSASTEQEVYYIEGVRQGYSDWDVKKVIYMNPGHRGNNSRRHYLNKSQSKLFDGDLLMRFYVTPPEPNITLTMFYNFESQDPFYDGNRVELFVDSFLVDGYGNDFFTRWENIKRGVVERCKGSRLSTHAFWFHSWPVDPKGGLTPETFLPPDYEFDTLLEQNHGFVGAGATTIPLRLNSGGELHFKLEFGRESNGEGVCRKWVSSTHAQRLEVVPVVELEYAVNDGDFASLRRYTTADLTHTVNGNSSNVSTKVLTYPEVTVLNEVVPIPQLWGKACVPQVECRGDLDCDSQCPRRDTMRFRWRSWLWVKLAGEQPGYPRPGKPIVTPENLAVYARDPYYRTSGGDYISQFSWGLDDISVQASRDTQMMVIEPQLRVIESNLTMCEVHRCSPIEGIPRITKAPGVLLGETPWGCKIDPFFCEFATVVTEDQDQDSFELKLLSLPPEHPVTVRLIPDPEHYTRPFFFIQQVTVDPEVIVWTKDNYTKSVRVNVTAIDDDWFEDYHWCNIRIISESMVPSLDKLEHWVWVGVVDNERPYVVIETRPEQPWVTSELHLKLYEKDGGYYKRVITNETGWGVYYISLASRPRFTVNVSIHYDEKQVTLNTSLVIITVDNWDIPQPVKVEPVHDYIDENHPFFDSWRIFNITHNCTSLDVFYQYLKIREVYVEIMDDDDALMLASQVALPFSSAIGGELLHRYSLHLQSEPAFPVLIDFHDDMPYDFAIEPPNVTIQPHQWRDSFEITIDATNSPVDWDIGSIILFITGKGLPEPPGSRAFNLEHHLKSTDPLYNDVKWISQPLNFTQPGTKRVAVMGPYPALLEEGFKINRYSLALLIPPSSDVTVHVRSELNQSSLTHYYCKVETCKNLPIIGNWGAQNCEELGDDVGECIFSEFAKKCCLCEEDRGGFREIIPSPWLETKQQCDLGNGSWVFMKSNNLDLTWTTKNWMAEKTIWVEAVDDNFLEYNHTIKIDHHSSSLDPLFESFPKPFKREVYRWPRYINFDKILFSTKPEDQEKRKKFLIKIASIIFDVIDRAAALLMFETLPGHIPPQSKSLWWQEPEWYDPWNWARWADARDIPDPVNRISTLDGPGTQTRVCTSTMQTCNESSDSNCSVAERWESCCECGGGDVNKPNNDFLWANRHGKYSHPVFNRSKHMEVVEGARALVFWLKLRLEPKKLSDVHIDIYAEDSCAGRLLFNISSPKYNRSWVPGLYRNKSFSFTFSASNFSHIHNVSVTALQDLEYHSTTRCTLRLHATSQDQLYNTEEGDNEHPWDDPVGVVWYAPQIDNRSFDGILHLDIVDDDEWWMVQNAVRIWGFIMSGVTLLTMATLVLFNLLAMPAGNLLPFTLMWQYMILVSDITRNKFEIFSTYTDAFGWLMLRRLPAFYGSLDDWFGRGSDKVVGDKTGKDPRNPFLWVLSEQQVAAVGPFYVEVWSLFFLMLLVQLVLRYVLYFIVAMWRCRYLLPSRARRQILETKRLEKEARAKEKAEKKAEKKRQAELQKARKDNKVHPASALVHPSQADQALKRKVVTLAQADRSWVYAATLHKLRRCLLRLTFPKWEIFVCLWGSASMIMTATMRYSLSKFVAEPQAADRAAGISKWDGYIGNDTLYNRSYVYPTDNYNIYGPTGRGLEDYNPYFTECGWECQGCFCGEMPYMFGGVFFADGRVLEEKFEEYVQMVTVAIFVLFAVLLPLAYISFTTHAINRKIRYLGKERPELTWKMIKEKFKRLCRRKEKGRDVGLLDDQECYFHHRWVDMQDYLGFKDAYGVFYDKLRLSYGSFMMHHWYLLETIGFAALAGAHIAAPAMYGTYVRFGAFVHLGLVVARGVFIATCQPYIMKLRNIVAMTLVIYQIVNTSLLLALLFGVDHLTLEPGMIGWNSFFNVYYVLVTWVFIVKEPRDKLKSFMRGARDMLLVQHRVRQTEQDIYNFKVHESERQRRAKEREIADLHLVEAEAKEQQDLRDAAMAIAKEDMQRPHSQILSSDYVGSLKEFEMSRQLASLSKAELASVSESKIEPKIEIETKTESKKFQFTEASKKQRDVGFESSKVNPEIITTSKPVITSSTKRMPSKLGPVTVDNLKDDTNDSDAQSDENFVFM